MEFERNIRDQLIGLRASENPHLSKLIKQADRTPETITIRPATIADANSWCGRTSPKISCFRIRKTAEGAERLVLYFPPWQVDLENPKAHRGIVAHELSHVVDKIYNRYHSRKEIRERRAMFFHNMWRDEQGLRLFKMYNRKWDATDYQRAKSGGQLAQAVNYLFSHRDLPG